MAKTSERGWLASMARVSRRANTASRRHIGGKERREAQWQTQKKRKLRRFFVG
ncbi:MAG: hypothetical protein M1582_02900 [Actinobacteria bacterium]|nr:hypothetical protein [Actinomycetota bacterium]